MKKFLATLLILILLGGASLVYFLAKSFNAEAFQQQIVQTVSELTGHKLAVSGQTTVRWLPMPTFIMTGVYITNQSGSDRANMITADNVQVQIEWSSLLKTPLVVKSIELTKPTFYLERLESNRANWDLPLFSAPDDNLNDAQLLGTAPSLGQTKIDQITLKGGTVFYTNKITKQSFEIKNVNGDLSALSLKGPYTFKGSAHLGKEILSGSFTVGRVRNDSPATLTAKIQEKESGLSLDFNGKITKNDPKSILTGDASFTLKKPKPFLETLGIPVQNTLLTQSAVGSFTLEITPLVDTLKNLIIRFGDDDKALAMTSTLAYTQETKTAPAKLDGEVAFNTFDVAAFEPYFKNFGWKNLTTETKHPALTLKTNITDLKIGTETLKNVEGTLSYINTDFSITNGKATFPGQTDVTFSATSGEQNKTPYILIYTKGKTTAVKPLLSFLTLDKLVPGADQVKLLEADIRTTLAPNFASVQLNNLTLDATTITGSVDWETNKKKTAAIDLTVDNLNLDAYTGWKAPADKTPLKSLPSLVQQSAINATFLSDFDLTFKTNFKAITWHNLPLTSGALNGAIKDGTLTLNNMEFADTATASFKAAATITNIGKPAAALQSMSFSLNAAQLPLFLERASLTSSLPLFAKASDTKISGTLSGTVGNWKTNILAHISEAEIKVNGSLAVVNKQMRFQDFNVTLSHPNFQKFLGLIDVQPGFLKNLDGGLRFQSLVNGSQEDLKLTQLDASVGIQKLAGTLSYGDTGVQKLVANLTSPALDLERFIPSTKMIFENGKPSATKLDLTALNNWDISVRLSANRLTYKVFDLTNAAAAIVLKDKVLAINDFTGIQKTSSNAPFKANASLSWITEPTLKVSVDMADVSVRPDFFIVNKFSFGDGKMALKGDFLAAGGSPAAMLSSLGGSGNVTFTNGQFIGMDLAKIDPLIKKTMTDGGAQETFDTTLNRLLQLGKTPVTSLSGAYTVTKGVIRFMDMTTKTPTATATPTQLVWNMPAGSIELSMPITLNAYANFPPIVTTASVDGGKSLYASDTADLSNAVLGIVKKEEASQTAQAQQAQEKQAEATAANRQAAVKKAIVDANTVVKQVSGSLQNTSTEKAAQLLQNAVDALAVVNQLAIKEKLTPEQEDKILEYARLAVLKANEAKEAAAKDGVMDYRQTIGQFETKGTSMVAKMKQLQLSQPQIAIIPRLVIQAEKNLASLTQIRAQISNTEKSGEAALLSEATTAYKEIETAYENVMRFDSEQIAPANTEAAKPVRGIIRRPGIRN